MVSRFKTLDPNNPPTALQQGLMLPRLDDDLELLTLPPVAGIADSRAFNPSSLHAGHLSRGFTMLQRCSTNQVACSAPQEQS